MLLARRLWRDRVIVDVGERFLASSRISGELVDGSEPNSRIVSDNVLGPISVMCVEVPNRDALCAVFQRVECRDRDVAEITKAHRSSAGGVMTWRPHQSERPFAFHCRARSFNRRTGALARVSVDLWISRRVEIKIAARISNVINVLWRMGTQQFLVCDWSRFEPCPIRVSFFQNRNGSCDSGRAFRMPRGRIFDAVWVVKNNHTGVLCNMFVSKRDCN